jgi:hypothetical protein
MKRAYVGRQRACFSGEGVDVHADDGHGRGDLVGVVVQQLVADRERFLVDAPHGRSDRDDIAGVQLALVEHVLFWSWRLRRMPHKNA